MPFEQPHSYQEQRPEDAADPALEYPPAKQPRKREGRHLEQREEERLTCGGSTEAKLSNVEQGRPNEDAVLIDERHQTFGVLDGVGGYAGGEKASFTAAETLREELARIPPDVWRDERRAADHLRVAFWQAKEKVTAVADLMSAQTEAKAQTAEKTGKLIEAARWRKEKDGCQEMGTTVSLMHIIEQPQTRKPTEVIIAQLGDSRVYRLRNGQLARLTKDQSVIQKEIDADNLPLDADQIGDPEVDKRLQPGIREVVKQYRNEISGALGARGLDETLRANKGIVEPVISRFALEDGDVLMATSDGIHDNLLDREIQVVAQEFISDPQRLAEELRRAARERSLEKGDYKGRHIRAKDDDISAVAVKIPEAQRAVPGAAAGEPRLEVPPELRETWQGLPSDDLVKLSIEYWKILREYDEAKVTSPELANMISRAHGLRESFRTAQSDLERRAVMIMDREYKEAALEKMDEIMAGRMPPELGSWADDYDVELPADIAQKQLMEYRRRLKELQDPQIGPAVKAAKGLVTRFHWPSDAAQILREECLAAERIHTRRRIAQMERSLSLEI